VHQTRYKSAIRAKILVFISAPEPYPTKEHVTYRKEHYALDNIRDLIGALAAWAGQLVHAGRIHSHSARYCDCSADYPVDFRPAGFVRSAP
jgi:hypothetical protein